MAKIGLTMDIVLYILAAICLLVGFLGCFLPVLPGPPVSYIGLLLLQATDRFHFSVGQLVLWAVLGAKYSGGSKWGKWGCLVGSIVGIFLFAPWGILLGPFIGACIGELAGGKGIGDAVKAGFGAFVGFLVSVVLKAVLCVYFVYCAITAC